MARSIDIDIEELKKFIEVLESFQEKTSERLQSVEIEWATCNASWKGEAKRDFTKGFEETIKAVEKALDAGDKATEWLRKFQEILEEFERC